jgi:DNA-directed RNA polymerase specialized sigma24 family protein
MDALILDAAADGCVLTKVGFTRLLEWLDAGTDSHGETYLEMRRRLVVYFDRRNRPFADELADETFNRIGRTLELAETIAVTPPARYCYVVARFVLLEDIRRGLRQIPVEETRTGNVVDRRVRTAENHLHEQRLDCLDRCLERLKPEQRDLAVDYYSDAKRRRIDRRRDMARRLGITLNALGIRAGRIRTALEACVTDCCKTVVTDFDGTDPIQVNRAVTLGHPFVV